MRLSWIRAVLALGVLGAVGLLCQSCVDLLDLEGYDSAIGQLCAKLAACEDEDLYPDCVATAGARLAAADVTTRAAFLKGFADKSCLENCTNTRKCLDADPICFDSAQTCNTLEQCCGFSTGFGVCRGQCCIPGGAPCAGGGCCDLECIDGTCGGYQCINLDDACEHSGECCGELRCHPGSKLCLECLPDDSDCEGAADCCSGHCEIVEDEGAVAGTCAPKPCGAPIGAECEEAEDCCDGFCVDAPALGHSVCSLAECLPISVLCERHDTCCSGRCDPNFGCESACMGPGLGEGCSSTDLPCCEGTCQEARCCMPDGAPCDDVTTCCSKQCHGNAIGDQKCGPPPPVSCALTGGACLTKGDCCNNADCEGAECCKVVSMPCSHDICVIGDPLEPTCLVGGDPDATCIAAICTQHPHCCCTAWDQTCKDAVSSCGIQCPVPIGD